MIHCTDCDTVLAEDEIRWGFDDPYCEDCFHENYVY